MSPRYKWSLVAMLWWIAFFNYADRQAIFSVFPLLEKEMHLTPVQLGLLGSSFAWVYGLFAPIAGSIVDRIRRRIAILGGLYLWSGICMATSASRGFGALLFFRGAEGLGESFYFPAVVSLISDYHGTRNAIARAGLSPDQRVHRNHRRRILRGLDCPELRVAMVVCHVRRRGRSAGRGAQSFPARACATGARHANAAGYLFARSAERSYRAISDGGISVREFCRGGPAFLDAEISV